MKKPVVVMELPVSYILLGKTEVLEFSRKQGVFFVWMASVTVLAFGKSRWTDSMKGHINLQIVLQ